MAFLSRRAFCLHAAVSVGAFALPPNESEPDVALLYAQGVRMLKEGRTFEKAISRFTEAAQKDPANADVQIALGCACASRAASLAWAGVFAARLAADTAAYPKVVAAFEEQVVESRRQLVVENAPEAERKRFDTEAEEARKKFKSPNGRIILIKDDKTPFRLTPAELVAQLTVLLKDANTALEKGIDLCQDPASKAHAHYMRGWGLRLLKMYCDPSSEWRKSLSISFMNDIGMGSTDKGWQENVLTDLTNDTKKDKVPDIIGLPTSAQIETAFKEATETAPSVAPFWQARADYWAATHERAYPEKEATELYRRAANLDPKNANLWSHVYDRETAKRYDNTPNDAPSDDEVLADLRRAQARDKSNAWYGYEEAGRLFQTVSWNKLAALRYDASEKEEQAARDTPRTEAGFAMAKRAVALIERANRLPRFVPPRYRNSVPSLLRTAWDYVPTVWYESILEEYQGRYRELARACSGYAESLAGEKKNQAEAVRVLRIIQDMGLRMMGDPWPTGYDANGKPLSDSRDVIQALVGAAIVGVGHSGLSAIAKKSGDEVFVQAIADEQAAWKARLQKWRSMRALTNEDEPSVYEAYDRS